MNHHLLLWLLKYKRMPQAKITKPFNWGMPCFFPQLQSAASLCKIPLSLHLEGVQCRSLSYTGGCRFPLMQIPSHVLTSLSHSQLLFTGVQDSCGAELAVNCCLTNIIRNWPAISSTMCTSKYLCYEGSYEWIVSHIDYV